MKILLVVATDHEIIASRFKGCTILITGVGMVNTAIQLTKELLQNKYDLVINMGVAGSFSDVIKIGNVVEVVEDSFSELGFENGVGFEQFSDFELGTRYSVEGKTDLQKMRGITVNTVHGNEKLISEIVNRLNPDVESMEGAAVFKVCNEFGVPCIQIRAISNNVEKRNKANWNIPLAIHNLNNQVAKIIIEL
ncbi:MAG: futalosine hydrolase [Flavobacteriales bacterium]|jgi:futalosine hydrolase|nr:futalosine hydrolase [Flavobacteriales bacterium]MBT5090590.1 futalosine hydrolase [Flavobacteriales bacterium]MBT5750235.1 futalosine hydrolase [Flavobacteriales bacterium]